MPALDPRAALVQAGPYRAAAERALDDRPLERAEALAVLRSPDGDLPAVLSAAFAVRARHFGLLLIRGVDAAAILRAHIIALAIRSRGIMDREERRQ